MTDILQRSRISRHPRSIGNGAWVINRKAQRQPNPPNMKPRRKARKLKSRLMPNDSTAEAAGTPIISPSVPPMLLHSFLST
ncbi:40S ribosomal protein S9 [Fusarium oxysporum f. sp. albedinis]|nr:40S ribosomal protein S9 [Fusarium oxysporum f. sp. albedinis]